MDFFLLFRRTFSGLLLLVLSFNTKNFLHLIIHSNMLPLLSLFTYNEIQWALRFPSEATIRIRLFKEIIKRMAKGMWNFALNKDRARNALLAQLMKDLCMKHPVSFETLFISLLPQEHYNNYWSTLQLLPGFLVKHTHTKTHLHQYRWKNPKQQQHYNVF